MRLARFAWLTLAYNIAVILWGAYVRATGSGAGCGSHWPLCNGQVIPRAASAETLVEFSHRLTSGLALLAVVALFWWTRRSTEPAHPARPAAAWSLLLILSEAAVGAGLVLFELVADNASMARAMFMAAHLINTFFLLAMLALTAHWLAGGRPIQLGARPGTAIGIASGLTGLLIVGMSGAVAALGDTLYPAASLSEAVAADLSAASHMLIRLRVLHPVLAIGVGLIVAAIAQRLHIDSTDGRGHRLARLVTVLVGVQIALGVLNVVLLAPVWLQLLHLLVADALWIAFVLAGASALAVRPLGSTAHEPAFSRA